APLKRATVLTRVAQLAISRRLRGESLEQEEQDNGQHTRGQGLHQRPWGVWGSHLMALAQAAGIATYQQLAAALNITVASAWRMLQHNTIPTLRHSIRETLCRAFKIVSNRLNLTSLGIDHDSQQRTLH